MSGNQNSAIHGPLQGHPRRMGVGIFRSAEMIGRLGCRICDEIQRSDREVLGEAGYGR
jgi:hypothetical protein